MNLFSKQAIESATPVADDLHPTSQDQIGDKTTVPVVGELDFDESTRGGLGRHLGIFSTIFLM